MAKLPTIYVDGEQVCTIYYVIYVCGNCSLVNILVTL